MPFNPSGLPRALLEAQVVDLLAHCLSLASKKRACFALIDDEVWRISWLKEKLGR